MRVAGRLIEENRIRTSGQNAGMTALEAHQLAQFARLPPRDSDLDAAGKQGDQAALGLGFDRLDVAKVDDVGTAGAEENRRIQTGLERVQRLVDQRAVAAEVNPRIVPLGLQQTNLFESDDPAAFAIAHENSPLAPRVRVLGTGYLAEFIQSGIKPFRRNGFQQIIQRVDLKGAHRVLL